MKKILLILIISVFTGSCVTSKKKPTTSFMGEYQKRILGKIMGLNRLELRSRFNECGEWGGHNEMFDIYREEKVLYAEYTEDEIDCNKPYSVNKKIAKRKTIRLNKKKEKAIAEYLNSLLSYGLKMEYPTHAGTYYQAIMNDSTLILKYHSSNSLWNEYKKLKKELNK